MKNGKQIVSAILKDLEAHPESSAKMIASRTPFERAEINAALYAYGELFVHDGGSTPRWDNRSLAPAVRARVLKRVK